MYLRNFAKSANTKLQFVAVFTVPLPPKLCSYETPDMKLMWFYVCGKFLRLKNQ